MSPKPWICSTWVAHIKNRLKLDAPKKVYVKLKIQPEHREKVLANSTAYIADSTLVNVSGQKVVEVYNSANGGGPMRQNARIRGVPLSDALALARLCMDATRAKLFRIHLRQAAQDDVLFHLSRLFADRYARLPLSCCQESS